MGRSAGELRGQGREHLFTDNEIQAMRDLENPAFRQVFDDYQVWNTAVLDFAQKKGIIDPVLRVQWKRAHYLPFYRVGEPGIGTGSGGGVSGEWRGIKALTGGTENIRDVLNNMVQNAATLIDAALKNEARLGVADLAKQEGGARFMAQIPRDDRMVKIHQDEIRRAMLEALGVHNFRALSVDQQIMVDDIMHGMGPMVELTMRGQPPSGPNVVAVMRAGKAEYYEVADPLLLRALMSLQRPARNWAVAGLASVRRIMQAGVTIHPNFLAAHVARDAVMGVVLSKNGFKPAYDSARGIFSRLVQDENYRMWVANGGGFIGAHLDQRGFRKHLEAFYAHKGIDPRHVLDAPHKVVWAMEQIADAFGSGTRLGEFSRATKKGVHPKQAAFQSREIATDFSMRGDSPVIAFFYDTVPFLNASTVSADRMIRGFYRGEEHRTRNAIKVGLLALATVALYGLNRTNPLYQQLEDWDKDAHWHLFIPKPTADANTPAAERYIHLRYPKAWEIGLVSTWAERTVGAGLGDNKNHSLAHQLLQAALEVEHLGYMPGALQPIAELAMNRNLLTGRPIQSQQTANLQPWARSTPGGSPTLRRLGEAERNLPEWAQVSPVDMETLLRGYMSNWADTGLAVTDWAMQHVGDAPPPPERRLDSYPLIRRFYEQEPRNNTAYVERFYSALQEATAAYQTMHRVERAGRTDLADELGQGKAANEYRALLKGDKMLSLVNKGKQAAIDARTLKEAQQLVDDPKFRARLQREGAWDDIGKLKRRLVDDFTERRNTLAKDIMSEVEALESRK